MFGQIRNGKMVLSEEGMVVQEEWLNLPNLRPGVGLDEFVVMPNHFHAILWLPEEKLGTASRAPVCLQN
jgi:putative transposase